MIDLSGQSIGKYHIIEKLGEGGMATVYRAFDTNLERDVAVKVIRREAFSEESLENILKRFDREAKTLAKLTHPNIVPIIDYGNHAGSPFLVMPYLQGGALKNIVGKPLPWPEAVKLIKPIASALAYAHSQGVIHRDIKPANILITASGEPMLTDFGIAKILEGKEGQTLTGTGVGIGTPEYMAPEQGMGKEIDAHADIYSLGVVFYELITGRKPYTADTPMAIVFKHLNDPLPKPGDFIAGLSSEVEKLVFKSMAKTPVDRYADMGEMLNALNYLERLPQGAVSQQIHDNDIRTSSFKESDQFGTINNQTQSVSTNIQEPPKLTEKEFQQIASSKKKVANTKSSQKSHTTKLIWISIVFLLVLAGSLTTILHFSKTTKSETSTAIALTKESTSTLESPILPVLNQMISPENANLVEQLEIIGKGGINQVVYSPSGDLLAVASSIGIYLYDSKDLSQIRYISTDSSINSVAFSPDGQTIASGSMDNTIEIWRIDDGNLLKTLSSHTGSVQSVSYSPDGQTIASGSMDNTIKIWRVVDGYLLQTLTGHTNVVNSVAFSPDGQTIASGSYDGTVKLWRVSDGNLVQTLNGHTDWVYSIAFSPDGLTLASGSIDGTINLWRISDGSLVQTLDEYSELVGSIAFTQDCLTLVSGHSDGTIKLWRISDGSLLQTLSGSTDPVSIASVVLSPDGQTIASGLRDGTIKLWRVSGGHLLRTLEGHSDWEISVAFSPDGKKLASGLYNNTINIWNFSDGRLLQTFRGHTGPVQSVVFSPDGQILASGSRDHTVRLWRVSDGSLEQTLSGHTDWVNSVVFSPDGQILASGSSDGTINLWRVSDGSLLQTMTGHSGRVNSIAFSPDGQTVASGTQNGPIELWRVTDGSLLQTLIGHTSGVQSVAFSSDGLTLASGSFDNTIKLWHFLDGELLHTFSWGNKDSSVLSVIFSPDGQTLASGSSDGTITLWRVSDGILLKALNGHTIYVNSVVFSPDGQTLASGSFDGTIRLWGIPNQ